MVYVHKRLQRRKKPKLGFFILFLAVLITIGVLSDRGLGPIIEKQAMMQADSYCNYIISQAIKETMKTDNIQYSSFIEPRSVTLPQILSLNTAEMNRVEADMTTSIQNKMEQYKSKAIEIRIGTLTGSYFLYDRGPALSCRVIPVSTVATKLNNQFTTAGINQTLHQIYLHVEVTVEILLPGFSAQTTVKSDYAIAETIILGPSPTYILGNQVVKP